jgi:isopenicillin N synthase-like dioxygenase
MAIGRLGNNRGYVGPGIEALDEKSGADHKEAFNLIWTDGSSRPANVWPELPGFQAVRAALLRRVLEVGRELHSAFAMDLGLEEDFFADKIDRPLATLRLLHYPVPRADATGRTDRRRRPHRLRQRHAARDRRRGRPAGAAADGTWVDAPALPGAFICNIGDCLMRWTNDIYVSTPHRVLRPAAERYSIAMFVDPNPEPIVRAIPPACRKANRPAHAPIQRPRLFATALRLDLRPRSS